MAAEFYEKFKNYDKEQLFKIALSIEEYNPEAITTAKQIIIEKGWKDELDSKLEER